MAFRHDIDTELVESILGVSRDVESGKFQVGLASHSPFGQEDDENARSSVVFVFHVCDFFQQLFC